MRSTRLPIDFARITALLDVNPVPMGGRYWTDGNIILGPSVAPTRFVGHGGNMPIPSGKRKKFKKRTRG